MAAKRPQGGGGGKRRGGMAGAHGDRLTPAAAGKPPKTAASGSRAAAGAAGMSGASASPPPLRRKGAGFLHASASAVRMLKEASARRGFAEPRILTDWDAIMGAALAPVCRPVKVSYAGKNFGATLVVLAEGPRAPEVQMLGPKIVERVNAHYGYRAVSRIRVVQTDARLPSRIRDEGVSAAPRDGHGSAAVENDIDPHAAAASAAATDPGLSAALARLGRSRAARQRAAANDRKGRKA
ncbi:MAG: DUF721 domain-containing protein [Pseudomonadota bacterium]